MDLTRLVFDVGDRVSGWGQISEDDDGIWLNPPYAVPLGPFGVAPRRAHTAVRLLNADLKAVTREFTDDGVPPGWATAIGIWLGDAIRIEHQTRTRPSRRPEPDVIRPPWNPDQLQRVIDVLRDRWWDWEIEIIIGPLDEPGHAYITVHLLRVLPDIAEWAVSLPDQLLQIEACLSPYVTTDDLDRGRRRDYERDHVGRPAHGRTRTRPAAE